MFCYEANYATFEPYNVSLESLVNLTLIGGALTALIEGHCLTPAVVPSLRLFHADDVTLHDGFVHLSLTFPSTLYAASLYHLSLEHANEDLLPRPLILDSVYIPLELPLHNTALRHSNALLLRCRFGKLHRRRTGDNVGGRIDRLENDCLPPVLGRGRSWWSACE